jgi:hypothetical protein
VADQEITQPTADVYASWKSALQELAQVRQRMARLEATVAGAFAYGSFNHDPECMVLKEAKVGLVGECTCGYQAWLDSLPTPTDSGEESIVAEPKVLLAQLAAEIERQDRNHPQGYPATRDGILLAIATAEEELREARAAWRAGRPTNTLSANWIDTGEELLQTAAVIMRAVRSIATAPDG